MAPCGSDCFILLGKYESAYLIEDKTNGKVVAIARGGTSPNYPFTEADAISLAGGEIKLAGSPEIRVKRLDNRGLYEAQDRLREQIQEKRRNS